MSHNSDFADVSAEKGYYAQSYEDLDTIDSAVLIMPLVFFISAADPRFTSTLDNILKTPEKGGLTANNMVYRYNTEKSDDGVGGEEGAPPCVRFGLSKRVREQGFITNHTLRRRCICLWTFWGTGITFRSIVRRSPVEGRV